MAATPPSRWCRRPSARGASCSLGQTVHGNGVHLDDYETHDDRRLIPGTGFTIEPGIYTDTFGVRTEINMFIGERTAEVSGPLQQEIVTLA